MASADGQTPRSGPPPAKPTPLWVRLAPVLLIFGLLAFVVANGWHKQISLEGLKANREALSNFVNEHMWIAILGYAGIYVAFTALMIPGALWITIAGGFLFGLAGGSFLTVLSATLGASLLFLAARTALADLLRERAGPFLQKLEAGFRENPLSYMFSLRFIPVVPFPVANIAPALLGAKFSDFVISTALGVIPGVVAYSWIGAGLGEAFDSGAEPDLRAFALKLTPPFIVLALVALLPVAIKRFGPKKPASKTSL